MQSDGKYLFEMKEYLESKGLRYDGEFMRHVSKRKNGKTFTFQEHVKGLIYTFISDQTKWVRIEPRLPQIDELFFNYDVELIKSKSGDYFKEGIFALKCGSRKTSKQMAALHHNIELMECLVRKYGSMDDFVTSDSAEKIVAMISKSGSDYKFGMIGEALGWEYLRNVGVDGIKPDTHIRRFFSCRRMGEGNNDPASIKEALAQGNRLAEVTGLTKLEVDNIIWSYCADKYGEICISDPHCDKCVIYKYCKHNC